MLVKIKNAVLNLLNRRAFKRADVKIERVSVKQDGEWKTFVPAKPTNLVCRRGPNGEELPLIADPIEYLGEGYGGPLIWTHPDDLFVDFQIVKEFVADDVDFFFRYMQNELTTEERDVYPYFYTQCFAEVKEVVLKSMQSPLLEISDEQSCFIVFFQNVMGLLLFSRTDADDVKRRSFGFEDVPEKMFYQMTFMRFDHKVVEKLGLTMTPNEFYSSSKKLFDPLRVNFASYNENE